MTLLRPLLLLLALLFAAPAAAQQSKPNIAATLVAESERPAPGSKISLALAMRPAKTWHGYWANPGDAGVGPEFKWTLPAGISVGAAQYPVPHRLVIAGLMNYVYEGDYAHLFTLTVPANAVPGTRPPLRLAATWLACTDEICVPEQGEFELALTIGDGAVAPAAKARFDGWRAALPRPLGSPARFEVAGETLKLGIPFPAAAAQQNAYFFPLTDGAIDYAAPQVIRRDGDMLTIEARARDGAAKLSAIEGVLAIGEGEG